MMIIILQLNNMTYTLHATSGTMANYSTLDITKYVPGASKGHTVYDYKSGNTYIIT